MVTQFYGNQALGTGTGATKSASQTQGARLNWYVIIMLAWVHAMALLGFFFFSWSALAVFGVLYVVTVLGITLGFHRLFTHRAFKTTRFVEYLAAICGTLALQGTIREWVAHHRMHHSGSDTAKDPHDASQGFWFSHLFWMCLTRPQFDDPAVRDRYARDIIADPFLRTLSLPSVVLGIQIALGLILLALGGLPWVIWGVFVRLAVVYNVTWLVNSAAHKWGYKNYDVNDLATNNPIVGILAMGEGWHNNHHAFPNLANHGHRIWEIDPPWMTIRLLSALGLAWDVKYQKYHESKKIHLDSVLGAQPVVSTSSH